MFFEKYFSNCDNVHCLIEDGVGVLLACYLISCKTCLRRELQQFLMSNYYLRGGTFDDENFLCFLRN